MTHYTDDTGNTAPLTGDDDMAFRFLRNAADAILARSSLALQLSSTAQSCADLTSAVSALTDVKEAQASRIGDLERQLAEAHAINLKISGDNATAWDQVRARQSDIDLLDITVANLVERITAVRRSRDYWQARSSLTNDNLALVRDTLNAVHSALGKPPLEPDPVEEVASTCGEAPPDEAPSGTDVAAKLESPLQDPRFNTGDPAMDAALVADDKKLEVLGAYANDNFAQSPDDPYDPPRYYSAKGGLDNPPPGY